MNAVVIAVVVMLLLSLLRVNVVIALIVASLVAGLSGGLTLDTTIATFSGGLGGGAEIALSYAMLGTFAVAISRSGITDVLAHGVIRRMGLAPSAHRLFWFKYGLLLILTLIAISSQNLIPIHIAFIPILIPPLLHLFSRMNLDRRAVACVLTFGLITPYMVLPIGFGGIFLNNILLKNLNENGLQVTAAQVPSAMLLPGLGMLFGLLLAIFFSYRRPRRYSEGRILSAEPEHKRIHLRAVWVAVVAIIAALGVQLATNSIVLGALMGFVVFILGGVIHWRDTQDVFTRGVHMMAMIGFIMITASGFAAVIKATGSVDTLVTSIEGAIGGSRGLAAFLMLVVGLVITMGIGSSFSTVPIIAAIYVPLCIAFGFSPMATITIIGVSGALGDAGSPASDSTLGPTSGLNMDGQHDHIWDSVVPTFLHYNLPLLGFGWAAAMIL
ncbi:Na+/H+ antiporter family protein [Edwardsiella anguillarum]|uniref:Na+/H+ antiporter family protein n=1 Tax=Edwardsiella anguillarum TaxID=1821960 RepID=UPI0024B68A32|nr:Na+/H+ antiporter NhaC family protein [Edwardsiella anguillarum]WHP81895.1 TRAP transporter large permease subunit [Edwardsiella anguillarum]WHQ19397.1 TRAP transporter large permease subunit [Edwardsiella anguillarum]WHQ22943.1 TRAP transporter large permease subunit [Edwardsiella anguillarum]WHQ26467.1 TRAP transporter large permease subunit [Edwardsiella anguillarum]WHQ29980.1 TRAP transporter large permease subunit [Edwardsiella anguillarum]